MSDFKVATYSPSDVVLSIGGYTLTGWQNITIARRSQGFVTIPGIRGVHTRVPTNDTSATINIPLLQTSPSNDVLSEIHSQDLLYGTGRISLTLKDMSGNSVFSSNEAYITGYPQSVFSGGFEYRPWGIFCQVTDSYTVGGNTRPSTSLLDSAMNAIGSFF